jgi:hypothetical protein
MSRTLRVRCPECSALLTIDAQSGAVLDHRREPRSRAEIDLARANDTLRRQELEREDKFRDSVAAEKRRSETLGKKFDEGLKRAGKESGPPAPTRDIDLD